MRATTAFAAVALAGLAAGCIALKGTQTLQSVGKGAYKLEKQHASLVWRIRHQGISNYTARLTDFDASLDFDPANPAASSVKAIINPMSVRAEHPTDKDWDARIGGDFLGGSQFPQIVFVSTRAERTGEFTGKVTGDLTFLGVTRPVTLDVTYNGTLKSPLFGFRDEVGFSARAVLKRSDWGADAYESVAGDDVEIIIEAEFVKS